MDTNRPLSSRALAVALMAGLAYVDGEVRDGATYVNGAKVLASVPATNGIVHVVDKVFLVAAN